MTVIFVVTGLAQRYLGTGAGVLLKCDMWLVSALSVFTEDEVMRVLKQGA